MKSARQVAILEIIAKENIETQEDLAKALLKHGFQVTQATVSRDIRELRLQKELTPGRRYRYAAPEKEEEPEISGRILDMFSDTIVSIRSAYNQIVIKTLTAGADIAAEVIDQMEWPEVLGTIAGENTILLILRTMEETPAVMERLRTMTHRGRGEGR